MFHEDVLMYNLFRFFSSEFQIIKSCVHSILLYKRKFNERLFSSTDTQKTTLLSFNFLQIKGEIGGNTK